MAAKSEDGIALVAVLWMVILLSIVAVGLSLETRSNSRAARNMAEIAAARMAADAGIQRAILDLDNSPGGGSNGKRIRADGTVYTWRYANCVVRISIRDQLGKVNLNQAPEDLLAAMIAATGASPAKAQSLAEAIADFRDADNLPRSHGAEETEYREAGLKWGPANAPFHTVEELQQVLGMTPEIYAGLAPDLTTYSLGFAVNPVAAGDRLIGILRQAGFRYFGSQSINVFSIRAESTTAGGSVFTREAVIQLLSDKSYPWVLSWQQLDLAY
jgi:general secretion pathway protein K